MHVPFFDLSKEYRELNREIHGAIHDVLQSGRFILGEQGERFEQEFSSYLNTKYSVGVASGTDGLTLSLLAMGVGKGDEVITQANTFIATIVAITLTGAKPVLVDVDPNTHQIAVDQIEKAITPKTKVIIPVHLYGSPSPVHTIVPIAKKHSIQILEDACQAHGAMLKGKSVGTFGSVSVFSFYPSKNLGAYGDGGAVVTNSLSLTKKLRLLRNYGQSKKYHHDTFGVNSRLDELQAAVLRVKLKNLNKNISIRRNAVETYKQYLKKSVFPAEIKESTSVYHLFVIEHPTRDKLSEYLSQNGIDTAIHYPIPVHLQKVYSYLNYKKGDFPVSERLASRILSLPLFYGISKKQIKYVSDVINSF